ncbi:MAG: aminodeoxychorismate synthase component I [Armatimonadetes bacterium]|nr:aminodeoxychorismate synthase component I [Armatimonadota bacterium]NCO95111.1 aminodeoxychorismate synthase component I [Armatimonadota bacterium]NCP33228.1 aminodeoxychorismate synthase component I [Armatimonadota bacterium]NDK13993.1 aminodeoxychorismate synthase component I [Armatimonadota bacterium]
MAAWSTQLTELSTPIAAHAAFDLLRRGPGDAFLDSGMRLGRHAERSLLLFSSGTSVRCHGRQVTVSRGGLRQQFVGDPFSVLRDLLGEFSTPAPGPGAPLCGAAVGYLGYDLCHFVEELPRTVVDDLGLPDMFVHFCPVVVTFDHESGRSWVGWTDTGQGVEARLAEELATRLLTDPPPSPLPPVPPLASRDAHHAPPLTSNFTHQAYVDAVRRAQDYILAGDIYQVNLSQRFAAAMPVPSWDLYRRLRSGNPAPFAAYLDYGPFQLLSASPERFLWLDPNSRRMHTRPIKGTRPRGADADSDRRNAQELLASEKDHAEHLMIVDLERNDLGRVAETGSVAVTEHAALETFPTVHHLTSTIEATLREDCDQVDLLRATFPGGSITGAPKIRAMEIIDELEPTKRGVYTGALGYLGFDGSLDLNIVIRTMVVKDGVAYFHAGGGIVADSVPEAEYQETLDKARGLVEALDASRGPNTADSDPQKDGSP